MRICGIVERCERAVETAAPVRKTMTVRLNAQVVGPVNSDNSNGGESISVPKDTPVTMLADAAMVLRDAPVFHMLLHETVRLMRRTRIAASWLLTTSVLAVPQIRTLQGVVEREMVPKDDVTLGLLTKVCFFCPSHCSLSGPPYIRTYFFAAARARLQRG